MLPPPRPKIGGHLTILKEAASLWSGLRRRITCAICAMFSDFDADPLLIHPSLNHGMGIVAAAQILKEKSVALDPSQTCEKYFCVGNLRSAQPINHDSDFMEDSKNVSF